MTYCRLLALSFCLLPTLLWAESNLVPLAPGQDYSDVQRLWGPPDLKVTMEAKRSDYWTYKSNIVTFTEGKVSAVSNAALYIKPAPKEDVKLKPDAIPEATKVKNQNAVDDILDEIIESGSDSASPSSNEGPATLIPPAEMPALPAFRQLERPAPGLNQPNPFEALRKRMLEAQQKREES